MARCGCAGSEIPSGMCSCALSAGANTTVTGTGQPATPWVVNAVTNIAEVRAALSANNGVQYNSTSGVISAKISTDAGNSVILGGDGGLFVPAQQPSSLGLLIFNTPPGGSFVKASFPTATWVRVRVVGGGGGSASTGSTPASGGNAMARGGGGGGSYGESWMTTASLPASVAITVGAGGIAGTPAGTPTAGGTGGASSFGTFVTANGGVGSPAPNSPSVPPNASIGGAGGAATGVGQISMPGQMGFPGFMPGQANTSQRMGGAGGASLLGVGGATNAFQGQGLAGQNYGGGASGSVVATDGNAGLAGMPGAPGVVIVEMFR